MIHAGESVEQFRRNVGQGVVSIERLNDKATTFSGTLRDVAITAGLATMAIGAIHNVSEGWIGSIVKINAEMERLKFLLAGMNKSADPIKEAAQQVAYLRDFAKDAPFSLKALSDSFVKLKSTGIDPMGGALKGLVDGIAAFGGNDEVLHRASIAIQQMAGKGVIQMEELRQQLGEAMPRAVELMARSMGVSTAELIQTVSKGTLDAKSSLAAFTMELDRTFGGAAANQMNTFNGLVAKTTTLFQGLALQAGDAGFFETIKDKLRQVNEALSGQKFEQFASAAGRFGASLINMAATGVQTMIQFKDEILNVGLALGTAFGASKIAQIIQGFGFMMTNMRAGIADIRIRWAGLAQETSRAFAGLGTAFAFGAQAGTLTNMAGIWATLTQSITGTGVAIRGLLPVLGAAFAFIAEFALPLAAMGAALYFVYEAFTKQSRAAEEAYDSLVKFGAQTDEQITLASKHVDALRAQAAAMKALKAAQTDGSKASFGAEDSFAASAYGVTDKNVSDSAKAAEEADKKLADERSKFEKARGDRFAQEQDRQLQELLTKRKAGYDKESIAADQAHSAEMEKLKNANKDTSAEKQRYMDETRDRQLAQYKLELQDAQSQLDAISELAKFGDADAVAGQEKRSQQLIAVMADRQKKITDLQDMPRGPQEIQKDTDIKKLIDKATAKLDGAKADIAAQKAEIQGLSGEYARLAFMMEEADAKANGMFRLNNPGLQNIINQLKDAQVEADKVKEELEGLKAFDGDLASANANARQDYLKELNNGKSSVFDSIAGKGQAGMYSGKSAIARLLGDVTFGAEQAGKAMNDAFGAGTTDKGATLTGVVERLSGAWKSLRDNAAGVVPQGGSTTLGIVGGDYASKVIAAESGGNPNATNSRSSAAGLGQFTDETFRAFLREQHPDQAALGDDVMRRLKLDPKYARDAVDWYGNKNAATLSKNGYQANDANTYLAHFLGAGGAMSVLGANPSTPLDQIKALDAARKSNPEVFGRAGTAGGLQAWAEARMGEGSTTSRNSGGSSYEIARGMATNDAQRRSIDETKTFEDLAKSMKGVNDIVKFVRDAKDAVSAAQENEDGSSKFRNSLTKMIRGGKAFPDNLDPSSPAYADTFKIADQQDAALREATEAKKRNERLKQIRENSALDSDTIDDKTAEALKRLQSGDKFHLSDGFYTEQKKTAKNVGLFMADSDANPQNKAANDQMVAQMQSDLEKRKNLEVTTTLNAENQKYEGIKQSLMTTDQARQNSYELEVRRLQDLLQQDTSTGDERVQKEKTVADRIALLRQQQFSLTPLGGMLKQWSDYGHNLETAATGWMNGFNDKLADLVMHGRVSFRSLAQSIEKDILTMSMKAAESRLFSSFLGLGGGGGGVAGTMQVGDQSFVAFHHTGGVAGSSMPSRRVNMNLFAGANRWHTGTGGMTLGGDEIPIIAKRGEQVDWPANLARQYGGKTGGTFAMGDINVHGATDGSPTQNRDLAEQIAGQVRAAASQMVGQELRTQMRPGGTIRAMSGK
jgi:tape measure domain-containing protein